MKLLVERAFFREFTFNKRRLKHSMNIECAENIRSLNVRECELSLICSYHVC